MKVLTVAVALASVLLGVQGRPYHSHDIEASEMADHATPILLHAVDTTGAATPGATGWTRIGAMGHTAHAAHPTRAADLVLLEDEVSASTPAFESALSGWKSAFPWSHWMRLTVPRKAAAAMMPIGQSIAVVKGLGSGAAALVPHTGRPASIVLKSNTGSYAPEAAIVVKSAPAESAIILKSAPASSAFVMKSAHASPLLQKSASESSIFLKSAPESSFIIKSTPESPIFLKSTSAEPAIFVKSSPESSFFLNSESAIVAAPENTEKALRSATVVPESDLIAKFVPESTTHAGRWASAAPVSRLASIVPVVDSAECTDC